MIDSPKLGMSVRFLGARLSPGQWSMELGLQPRARCEPTIAPPSEEGPDI